MFDVWPLDWTYQHYWENCCFPSQMAWWIERCTWNLSREEIQSDVQHRQNGELLIHKPDEYYTVSFILHVQLYDKCGAGFILGINPLKLILEALHYYFSLPLSLNHLSLTVQSTLLWCMVPVCFCYTGRMSWLKWDFPFFYAACIERKKITEC